jgi:hypothetical protein
LGCETPRASDVGFASLAETMVSAVNLLGG